MGCLLVTGVMQSQCLLGKMSSKTILLLRVKTWTDAATAQGSCHCHRAVFCRTYLDMWTCDTLSLPQAKCKRQSSSSSPAEAGGDDLPASGAVFQVKEPWEGSADCRAPGTARKGLLRPSQRFWSENNLNPQQGEAESLLIRLGTGDSQDADGSEVMAFGITHVHLQIWIYSVP